MSENICSTCLFFETCQNRRGCDGYYPLGDAAEDVALDTYIEERRREFHEEWYSYIREDLE